MYNALFALLAVTAAEPAAAPQAPQAPVKVWLTERGVLDKGDRVRVRVRTEFDGYLLVLHAEPDGRVRVVFPLDPYHDNFIRGREDYELPGRGDRETFRVFASEGVGTVYAAFSRDPFRVQDYARGDHWDYLLEVWQVQQDAEAELTALAERMALGGFDYDLVRYGVGRAVTAGYGYTGYDRYRSGSSFHVSIGFGRSYVPFSYRYRRAYYYSRCHDWYWYDAYYYDSSFCSPYRYSHYDPWYPYWYDPYYRSAWYYDRYYYRRPRPVIVYYQPGSGPTRFVDRRFTMKQDHNVADGSGLLDMRRRVPSDGATVRRTLATSDVASGRRTVSDTRRVPTTAPTSVRRPTTNERRPDVGSPTVTRRPADTRRPEAGPTTVVPRRPVDSGVRRPETRQPDRPANIRRVEPTVRDRQAEPVRREVQRQTPERRETTPRVRTVAPSRQEAPRGRVIAPSRPETRRVEPARPQVRQQPAVRREPPRAAPSRTPTRVQRSPSPQVRPPARVGAQPSTRSVAPPRRVVRPKAPARKPVRKPVRRKKN